MPKGSEELTKARKEEIVSACGRLYETMNFKDITIKDIGNEADITRTLIYHYFQTKEEIFLSLLKREYELWNESMRQMRKEKMAMTPLKFAETMARSLEERKTLLKLLSMNHYDLEENCRMEKLVEFKRAYGRSLNEVDKCLVQYFPDMTESERKGFIFSFFPFMFGIYPYTVVSEKQRKAMELAHVNYVYFSIYDITLTEIMKLLRSSLK